MTPDISGWSGDGELTRALVDALAAMPAVLFLKVEDAPSSRAEPGFTFVSNELFVSLGPSPPLDLPGLGAILARVPDLGAPDYGDDGMLQYLRTERIVRPYQTKGYKLIEMVRLYRVDGAAAPDWRVRRGDLD